MGIIATIAALLMRFRGLVYHLCFAALAIAVGALLLAFILWSHKWTPLTPALAAVLAAWLLSSRFSRYLSVPKPSPAE